MKLNRLSWLIGGEAGYGIMASGAMFSRACSRGGLHVFDYAEYPSLIRGGHNSYYVRVDGEEIFSQMYPINILVALNKETVDKHLAKLTPDGCIIYDADELKDVDCKSVKLYPVPLLKLATDAGGDSMMRNTVAVGASLAVAGYPFEFLKGVIDDVFKGKSQEIIAVNEKAAQLGYEYASSYKDFQYKLQPVKAEPRVLVTGNEAFGLGALKAGCKFLAAYPMTPINALIAYLASKEHEFNIIVKQPEDEISAINMAIGASMTGARSMTCTSGGGFCLMVEGLGLAGITEVPVVIIMGQRPGPSTGLPTWTEQSDLKFILNAAHGEFPRIVMAPGDVTECFSQIQEAFYLAEKYQLPVIVITDKLLSESHKTAAKFDCSGTNQRHSMLSQVPADYKRFAFTDWGISPRALPGQPGGIFMATSDEHNEHGFFCEDAENRVKMMDKRARKLEIAADELPAPKMYGPQQAQLTVICWGSTKGAVLEAFKLLDSSVTVNMLHLTHLWPFPAKEVSRIMQGNTLIIESNKSGQLASLIREQTGVDARHKYLKYDGRPFYPEDIKDKIMGALR